MEGKVGLKNNNNNQKINPPQKIGFRGQERKILVRDPLSRGVRGEGGNGLKE